MQQCRRAKNARGVAILLTACHLPSPLRLLQSAWWWGRLRVLQWRSTSPSPACPKWRVMQRQAGWQGRGAGWGTPSSKVPGGSSRSWKARCRQCAGSVTHVSVASSALRPTSRVPPLLPLCYACLYAEPETPHPEPVARSLLFTRWWAWPPCAPPSPPSWPAAVRRRRVAGEGGRTCLLHTSRSRRGAPP